MTTKTFKPNPPDLDLVREKQEQELHAARQAVEAAEQKLQALLAEQQRVSEELRSGTATGAAAILALRSRSEALPVEVLCAELAVVDAKIRGAELETQAATGPEGERAELAARLRVKEQESAAVNRELLELRQGIQRLEERSFMRGHQVRRLQDQRAAIDHRLRELSTGQTVRTRQFEPLAFSAS